MILARGMIGTEKNPARCEMWHTPNSQAFLFALAIYSELHRQA